MNLNLMIVSSDNTDITFFRLIISTNRFPSGDFFLSDHIECNTEEIALKLRDLFVSMIESIDSDLISSSQYEFCTEKIDKEAILKCFGVMHKIYEL